MRRYWLALATVLILGSRQAIGAVAGVPDDLQQLFDQGQYQSLLLQLNATIAKKTAKSDAVDRYNLLMLKGETLLRLKAGTSAADAFSAAALAGTDDNSIAIAAATANLIKHSGAGKYQPRIKSGKADAPPDDPIDILDPSSRKEAFAACFTDLLETIKPQVTNAENTSSLTPIAPLAKKIKDLGDIEIAAVGSDPQSKDLLAKLATHAAALMNAALKPMPAQITTISQDAANTQKLAGKKATPDELASLSVANANQLNDIVSQARQISTAATQMQKVLGDATELKGIPAAAGKIITAANKVLTQYKRPAA